MHIFFTPDISGNTYTLNEDESKHCIRVLRLNVGDELNLVDGRGGYYSARIVFDNPKACKLEISSYEENFQQRPYFFHLAIAPTKNTDRLEWMVEKAVEIGVDEITPIICEHSERKQINTERLNRIAISAMKQSVKAFLPKINEAASFRNFAAQEFNGQKFIAHCIDEKNSDIYSRNQLQSLYTKNSNALCLIGPEGDFSPAEVDFASKNGYSGVSLGNSRLRTETAGLVACHTIYLLNS